MANELPKTSSQLNGKEGSHKSASARKKKDKELEELSEEDRRIKEGLDLLVERVKSNDKELMAAALTTLFKEVSTATSSVTSVPKPLKLLLPHFDSLAQLYKTVPPSDQKRIFADILSILSTAYAKDDDRRMLRYRLEGTPRGFTLCGHEYTRNLSTEIAAEFAARTGENKPVEDLLFLVDEIVPFYMKHNAEGEAVDLLCEVDEIERIIEHVDKTSFNRVVLYIQSMANYADTEEEKARMLKVSFKILMDNKRYPDALRVAMKQNDVVWGEMVVKACEDPLILKQLALMCSRQRMPLDFSMDEELTRLAAGELFSTHFQHLAKELDVLEPKLPEDVFKTHLEERRTPANIDSAKQNLASTFVNAFVNAGFCKDKLMMVEGTEWLYKNKEHGMLSAVASLGTLLLWNVDEGLNQIDKYQYSTDVHVKAGAFMAFGVVNSNVINECDPAFALLSEKLESRVTLDKLGAILGLGFAYAGTNRWNLLEALMPCIIDESYTTECSAMAAMNLGLIFVGSGNQDVAEGIVQAILERTMDGNEASLEHLTCFYGLGLGLLFLGCRDACEPTVEALEAAGNSTGRYAICTIEGMAAAGSGNVLKAQKMLQMCVEKLSANDEEEMSVMNQAVAVLNIPLIALGEETGSEMSMRLMDHLLQYADIHQRRAIPLALALHSASTIKPPVIDALYKLTHDPDADVALHAIFGLGIVGAGTNNSRIAGFLRQLAAFYMKDANAMFIIRIAQGLLYMGKGLMGITPLHSDRFLLHPVTLGALLIVLHAALFLKENILGRQHYLLYYLTLAMYPRMLLTVDEDLNPLPVSVRVGQAVDTVGQAGQPRAITGFQTHNTPVLLSSNERAELATDEYQPLTTILEGVVILRKNPDYQPVGESS